MSKYFSTKHYGHNIGLSAVFRQPNADHSHCHFLHGYSLAFKFTFGCDQLDNKNWAVDFGGLKPLKKWLEDSFDHKTVVDINDPHMEDFKQLEQKERTFDPDLHSTLYKYAQKVDHITELGVRWVESTFSFLRGTPKKLISYDIDHPSIHTNFDGKENLELADH